MRKLIIAALAASVLAPVAAGAQTYRDDRREVRDDRRDIREDRRDLRQDRQEARGDWRDYRRDHGDEFRRGGYAGPRGYRYRPVGVGYRFAPEYYGRDHWVNDWQRYRLARPGYGQQWVRYGNDVVLIDLRSGRVATVFNSFFY
ncbi:RcnB family protein [Sphingomonas bacterium]|uniref:RcnB family protein n=1 Tax=Sphingomonas bacterium TaxID=1895847 RepID=UPI001576811D|nr:RcnB family protein [Sphingomonas bacterium]